MGGGGKKPGTTGREYSRVRGVPADKRICLLFAATEGEGGGGEFGRHLLREPLRKR